VAGRVLRAESFGARLKGLLGRASFEPEEGLWIEPCDCIHTFFMRFSIDAAFVDRTGSVVRRLDALAPWRATRLYARARACVELPAGTLARAAVAEGTRLALLPGPGASGPAPGSEGPGPGDAGGGGLPAIGSPGRSRLV